MTGGQLFYKIFKDAYPARCETFLVFNVGFVFKGIWALVRPFLDIKSQSCTFMIKDKAQILEFIAEDQLADFVGGANVYNPPDVLDEGELMYGLEDNGEERKEEVPRPSDD